METGVSKKTVRREKGVIKIPYKFRFLNRLYALFNGYYWLPCKLCGKPHGGHEDNSILMTSWYGGVRVCPACTERTDELNNKFMEDNPLSIIR